MDDDCEGCRSYDSRTKRCSARMIEIISNSEHTCPCSVCLIKSMCNNPCSPFSTLRINEGLLVEEAANG